MTGRKLTLNGWIRCLRHRDAGSALVELALSLPILITLLLGAVEFGRFAYLAIELTNAAKAAAQYGAQNSVTGADVTGMQLVAAQDAPEATAQCTGFTTTVAATSCACVVGGSSTGAACGSTCAGGYIVQNLNITTSAQCTPLIYPTGLGGKLTLSGHAVQEVLK
ncbi:MAG: TadE/TadG family type IV pilus assembly protein [Terracidiphilus sp.]|nr:TadE/TadG family type IV pilus assembly protein [Terracidiphilus sp.]